MSTGTSTAVDSVPTRKPTKVPTLVKREYDSLSRLSTTKLRQELDKSLRMTADHLRRLAVIVRLLEERGEDLSGLRIGILPYLRQIAYGQLLPEVITVFGGAPLLIGAVSQIPLTQQTSLVNKGTVDVVVRDGHDNFVVKGVDAAYLTGPQIRQVFSDSGIRTPDDQKQYLESHPLQAVSGYVRRQGEPGHITEVKLSFGRPEYDKLLESAYKKKMTIEELIRHTLQQARLI